MSYILKTKLSVHIAGKVIEYNVVNSVVDFHEIENEATRKTHIESFLAEGYIVKADKEVSKALAEELEEIKETTKEEPTAVVEETAKEVEEKKDEVKSKKVHGGKA